MGHKILLAGNKLGADSLKEKSDCSTDVQKHHLNLKIGSKDTRICNISVLFKLES